MKKLICSVVLCLALFGCSNSSTEDHDSIPDNQTIKEYGDSLLDRLSGSISENEEYDVSYESNVVDGKYIATVSANDVTVNLDMLFLDDSSLYFFTLRSDDLTIDNLGASVGLMEDIYPFLLAASTSVSANIAERIIIDINYISDSDYISKEIDNVSYNILYNSPLYESDVEGYVYTIDKPIGGYDFVPSEHPAYGRELTSSGSYSIMVSAPPEE